MNIANLINRRDLTAIVLLALLLLLLLSCSTKPKDGSISGNVVLSNDSGDPAYDTMDLSGVKVSLYNTVLLDSTILRLNQEYPNIGVIINQETEFKQKNQTAFKTAITDATGFFVFDQIPMGEYNLVFEKDGWGRVFRYNIKPNTESRSSLFDVFNEDDRRIMLKKDEVKSLTVVMYPIQILNSTIYNSFSFEADHCYRVMSDAYMYGECIFEGRSRIEVQAGSIINLYSDVISSGEGYCTIETYDDGSSSGQSKWDSMCVYSSNNVLTSFIITDSNAGIVFWGSGNEVSNSIIRKSNSGVHPVGLNTIICNVIFQDISNRAVLLEQSAGQESISFTLEKSILFKCVEGIRTMGNAVSIKNNYFLENDISVFSFNGFHEIRNNNFDRNNRVLICAGTIIPIEYNNFYQGNANGILFSYQYYSNVSNPLLNYNNFYMTSGLVIELHSRTTISNIDAKNSYWAAPDIDAMIWDRNDSQDISHFVEYLPVRFQAVATAGIIETK